MIIYHLTKYHNGDKVDGEYYVYFIDAKAQLEIVNEREERMFKKWKLSHRLRNKPFSQVHPDRWRIEEIEVHE